jgi:hypothetical protein
MWAYNLLFKQAMMKTNKWTILISCSFLLVATACSDFLDEDLQGVYSGDTYYKTEEQAIEAVNATYQMAAFTDIANCLWVFGDVASDDAVKGGNAGDQSDIEYIDNFQVTSDNGYTQYIWQHYYEGITRANNVIYYVPGIDMDAGERNRIVGEAKFLRAFYYFNLVNIFGKVPLKTKPALTSEELQVPLSSVSDVYEQIERDLTDAQQALPISYSSDELGRATRGAALGLLAKVCLFEEKWQKSVNAIDTLQSLDVSYSLMQVYRNNFELGYENNNESIFEIQHLSGQDPFEGSYLNQWFSPQGENGYYFDNPTQDLVDEYEVVSATIYDPRMDYSIGRDGGKWMNGEDFDPSWSTTGYLGKKHVQPLDEVSTGTKGDGGLNYTYMRYAEVLLMKAEALNELGKTPQALIPLNEVRKRARNSYLYDEKLEGYGTVPENLLPEVTSTDKDEVRTAIRHERRVELALEFHRFFDLMRYGKEAAESALSSDGFNYETDRYFPLPQSELDTNSAL